MPGARPKEIKDIKGMTPELQAKMEKIMKELGMS